MLRMRFLHAGLSPHDLLKGLGLHPSLLDPLAKYNLDQPRAPGGNGRVSGQFGSSESGASPHAPPVELIGHWQILSDISTQPAEPTVQVVQHIECFAFFAEKCKESILREFPVCKKIAANHVWNMNPSLDQLQANSRPPSIPNNNINNGQHPSLFPDKNGALQSKFSPGLEKESLVERLSWQIGHFHKAKGIKPCCHTGENPVCPHILRKFFNLGTYNVNCEPAYKYCGDDRPRIT